MERLKDMVNFYTIPNWFFGYDIGLEILFALITILVAGFAFKAYSLSKEQEFKLFGISFTLISLSYFAWSLINIFFVEELNEHTRVLLLGNIGLLSVTGIYLHILLFMTGLTTLFYMTCKVKSWKLYSLMIITNLLVVMLSCNKLFAIYTVSSLLIFFIVLFYVSKYFESKNSKIGWLLVAFISLLAANLAFLFENVNSPYVIAHLLELISFGIILINLVRMKHGKKKKSS